MFSFLRCLTILASTALIAAAVDLTFYEGTYDDDCAGDTFTQEEVPADACINDSLGGFSCLLVQYNGYPVATSTAYSNQGGNFCGVYLASVADGGTYSQTQAISGYKWTANSYYYSYTPYYSTSKRRRSSGRPRLVGYTVQGNLYNITSKDEIAEIPRGSSEMQKRWLEEHGYGVVEK